MKNKIAIIFIFIVLLHSSNKLWIVATFYFQQEYIASNLCINRFDAIPVCKGQCYLNNELKETENKDQNIPNIKVKEIQLYVEELIIWELSPTLFLKNSINSISFCCIFNSSYFFKIYHPPQLT
jgi:hypothetical protein